MPRVGLRPAEAGEHQLEEAALRVVGRQGFFQVRRGGHEGVRALEAEGGRVQVRDQGEDHVGIGGRVGVELAAENRWHQGRVQEPVEKLLGVHGRDHAAGLDPAAVLQLHADDPSAFHQDARHPAIVQDLRAAGLRSQGEGVADGLRPAHRREGPRAPARSPAWRSPRWRGCPGWARSGPAGCAGPGGSPRGSRPPETPPPAGVCSAGPSAASAPCPGSRRGAPAARPAPGCATARNRWREDFPTDCLQAGQRRAAGSGKGGQHRGLRSAACPPTPRCPSRAPGLGIAPRARGSRTPAVPPHGRPAWRSPARGRWSSAG